MCELKCLVDGIENLKIRLNKFDVCIVGRYGFE